jgi:hypothetical protein
MFHAEIPWGCAPSRCLLVDAAKNGKMTVRSALVEDTVKNRTGVANRPREQPLRSNSSRTTLHHHEERNGPTPRAAGIREGSAKTTNQPPTPPGRSPHHVADFHPPSMCDRHPPAGRRPNPATQKRRPTIDTLVAPTARRRRVEGPPQATHEVGRSRHGRPRKFLGENPEKPCHFCGEAAHRRSTSSKAVGPS